MSDKVLGILYRAQGAAQVVSSTKQVQGALGGLTGQAGHFASSLKGSVSGALTTFGGRLKQAALGLAAFGGVSGVLGVGAALEKSLSKAQDWGQAIEKLQPITGGTAQELSGLLAITEKFNIGADQLVKVAGFESKAVEAIALKAKGAAKFQKDYGFSIVDSQGKVKPFTKLLLDFADYYKSNTNEAQKNAAAAKLFGRSYTDLVPVLALGKQGIQDAEAEAAKLGLTLTQDNVVALAKAREATRKWDESIGGLEMQIGINLLPALSDLATAASTFVAQHGKEIIQFFKDAVTFGRNAASTIGDLAGKAIGFWNSIPAGLRDLLVKGIVADRTVKFLFGISPIKVVASLAQDALGGLAKQVGQSVAGAVLGNKIMVQHVWVDNPNFGGGPGGPGSPIVNGAEDAAAGGGFLEGLSSLGATGFAGLVGLALVPVLPGLIVMALDQRTLAQKQQADYSARRATAAARGLNPANVPFGGTGGEHNDVYSAWVAAQRHPSGTGGLSPDERQAANDQKTLADKIEASRIATTQRLEDVRNATDAAKSATIAQTAVTRTGDSAIVAAIRGIRLAVNLTVPITVPGGFTRTVTTKSGTTLVRIGGNGARGAIVGMTG